MQTLCYDVLCLLCKKLDFSSIVMLSISSKYFARIIPRNVTLLECAVKDNNVKFIELAQSWGCKWKELTWYTLGLTGNIRIFNRYAFCPYQKKFILPNNMINEVYNGACNNGNVELLKLIDDSYPSNDHYYRGMKFAVIGNNLKSIEYLIARHKDIIPHLPKMAVVTLNIELLKYCHNHNIQYRKSLKSLKINTDPEKLNRFLTECKKENLVFNKTSCNSSLDLVIVLLSHNLYDMSISHVVMDQLFESHGIIDWSNESHKKFVKACVSRIMKYENSRLYDYLLMENFLQREDNNNVMKSTVEKYKMKMLTRYSTRTITIPEEK